MTTSPGGAAIQALNDSLARHPGLRNPSSFAVKLTPFGLLEAIGLVPPKIAMPSIPKALHKKPAKEIADFLLSQLRASIESEPSLTAQSIQDRVRVQKTYTTPEAMELFEICVVYPASMPNFDITIRRCLAFDYLFKYQFDGALAQKMRHFLLSLFLNHSPMLAHSGKFRLVRRMWERTYPELIQANPASNEQLARINRSMSLKNAQDYFDCDLIAFVCQGYWDENSGHRVIALTQDDEQTLIDRVAVFKGFLRVAHSMCAPDVQRILHASVTHPEEGVIVSCRPDGTFDNPVAIAEVAALL